MIAYEPDRGHIVWLGFSPRARNERGGRSPALALTLRSYNETTSLRVLCPTTPPAKGYRFEVLLPVSGSVTGVVLAGQLTSVDWRVRSA